MTSSEASPPAPLERFDPSRNHFERLGLAPAVALDREALESAYLERSRRVHPDRFVTADAATQRLAMEHAAAVNEAYQVLRSPLRRAEYLVKLGGIDLDSSDAGTGAPKPTQAFLIEMIERREGLEAATEAGLEALEDLADELADEREAIVDAAVKALESGEVAKAAEALVHARYLARLADEIENAKESAA